MKHNHNKLLPWTYLPMREDTGIIVPGHWNITCQVERARFYSVATCSGGIMHNRLPQQCVLINADIHIHTVRLKDAPYNAVSILHLREQPRAVIIQPGWYFVKRFEAEDLSVIDENLLCTLYHSFWKFSDRNLVAHQWVVRGAPQRAHTKNKPTFCKNLLHYTR